MPNQYLALANVENVLAGIDHEFVNLAARAAHAARAGKKDKHIKSKKIDFSDISELSDKQLAQMRRVGRPPVGDERRKLIAIRLDAKVLSWLRETAEKKGKPYESLVNEILAEQMRRAS